MSSSSSESNISSTPTPQAVQFPIKLGHIKLHQAALHHTAGHCVILLNCAARRGTLVNWQSEVALQMTSTPPTLTDSPDRDGGWFILSSTRPILPQNGDMTREMVIGDRSHTQRTVIEVASSASQSLNHDRSALGNGLAGVHFGRSNQSQGQCGTPGQCDSMIFDLFSPKSCHSLQ
jgi:hypothetical protein